MAHLTIRVPEQHVAALRRELVRAYEERERSGESIEAEDLLDALEQLPEPPPDREAPDGANESMVDREAPDGAAGAVELTAHPEVLSDAVHALLVAALAELSATVDAYWRGADAGAAAGERLAEVMSLVELFRSVQDG